MALSTRGIASAALVVAGLVLAPGEGQAAPAPTVATGGGVTLRSIGIEFPDSDRLFPGDSKADAINNSCLACHSAGMVLTQPTLPRADWQAEVEKMRNIYLAPVAAEDVPAIVDYLAKLTNGK
jgi:cytochrome c5